MIRTLRASTARCLAWSLCAVCTIATPLFQGCGGGGGNTSLPATPTGSYFGNTSLSAGQTGTLSFSVEANKRASGVFVISGAATNPIVPNGTYAVNGLFSVGTGLVALTATAPGRRAFPIAARATAGRNGSFTATINGQAFSGALAQFSTQPGATPTPTIFITTPTPGFTPMPPL